MLSSYTTEEVVIDFLNIDMDLIDSQIRSNNNQPQQTEAKRTSLVRSEVDKAWKLIYN